jgi:hypothetical protein
MASALMLTERYPVLLQEWINHSHAFVNKSFTRGDGGSAVLMLQSVPPVGVDRIQRSAQSPIEALIIQAAAHRHQFFAERPGRGFCRIFLQRSHRLPALHDR